MTLNEGKHRCTQVKEIFSANGTLQGAELTPPGSCSGFLKSNFRLRSEGLGGGGGGSGGEGKGIFCKVIMN